MDNLEEKKTLQIYRRRNTSWNLPDEMVNLHALSKQFLIYPQDFIQPDSFTNKELKTTLAESNKLPHSDTVSIVDEFNQKKSQEKPRRKDNKYDHDLLKPRKQVKIVFAKVRPERYRYCPNCQEVGMINKVEREQFHHKKYRVFCPNMQVCWFLCEFKGEAVVNTRILISNGLPGQLEEHMDIYKEDINKIARLGISEYIKARLEHLTSNDIDLTSDEGLMKIITGFTSLVGIIQPPQCRKTYESELALSVKLRKIIAYGFCGFCGFVLPAQQKITQEYKPEVYKRQRKTTQEHKPEVDEGQQHTTQENIPEIDEELQKALEEYKSEVEEGLRKSTQEHKPEADEEQEKTIQEYIPEIDEELQKALEEYKSEVEEGLRKSTQEHKPEVDEKQEKTTQEYIPEIDEELQKALEEYKSEVEEGLRKSTQEHKPEVDEKQQKTTQEYIPEIDEELQKALEEYKSEVEEGLKKSTQEHKPEADEEQEKTTQEYIPEIDEKLQKALEEYKSEVEEGLRKSTQEHKPEVDEEQQKTTQEYIPEIDEELQKALEEYKSEVEEGLRKSTQEHKPEADEEQEKTTQEYIPEIDEELQKALEEYKSEVEEGLRKSTQEHKPEVDEEQQKTTQEYIPEIGEEQKNTIQEYKPEVYEEQRKATQEHKPEVDEEQKNTIQEYNSEVDEGQRKAIQEYKPEVGEEQRNTPKECKPEVDEEPKEILHELYNLVGLPGFFKSLVNALVETHPIANEHGDHPVLDHEDQFKNEFCDSNESLNLNVARDLNESKKAVILSVMMNKLADTLIGDIPIQYKQKVKAAFLKVQEYSFPEDYVHSIIHGKVKLGNILLKIDKNDEDNTDMLADLYCIINNLRDILQNSSWNI